MTERIPGRRGRLPVRAPADRLPIRYAHEYLAGILPPPVYPIDVTGGITAWGMLANDRYGDCGEAGIRHVEMATAACAGEPVPAFADQEAVDEYLAFTGGQDTGVNLEDFLLWLYQRGRIEGFAPVDHSDPAHLNAAMQEFRSLYVGVSLTPDAEQRFADAEEWTVADGQTPDPSEGHCIVKVKSTGPEDVYVTWGALQTATADWSKACLDEAYVVWTTEDPKVLWDELRKDLDAIPRSVDGPPKVDGAPGGGAPSTG